MRLVPVDFGTPQLAAGDADRGDALEFTPATPTVLSAKPRELTNRPPGRDSLDVGDLARRFRSTSGLIASSESANAAVSGARSASAPLRSYPSAGSLRDIARGSDEGYDTCCAEEPREHPSPTVEHDGPACTCGRKIDETHSGFEFSRKQVPDAHDKHDDCYEKIRGDQREELGVVGIVGDEPTRLEDIETDRQRGERGSRQERRHPRGSWERHGLVLRLPLENSPSFDTSTRFAKSVRITLRLSGRRSRSAPIGC